MFSGRVLALPDLHTIGACTGDMVAMVSPHDKSGVIGKPFNWNRVIRHELVHIFNLEQTKYKVPHWFTEGLAVMLEGGKPPGLWNHLLAEKVQANELLDLDTVLLGFIRPRSPDEWQQAYMQSLLYVEYLVQKHGDPAIGALLDAYRDGLDTGPAIEKVCKISKADFEKGYRVFLDERVKKLGAVVRPMSLKELKEAHAKDPKDVDIAARLAERLFTLGDKGDAGKLADDVLAAKKDHGLAAYVKARILAAMGEKDKALTLLDSVAKADPPEVKATALQAKLHFEKKNFTEAAAALERGRKIEPHEPAWLKQLAAVYTLTGESDKQIGVLKDLVPTEADDLVIRRKLAQLLEKANRHAEAEQYARMALEIDVLDGESVRILEGALTAQKKDDELKQLRKLLNK
jgi:tetratricopeptide (TPR) repeat protein